MKTKLIIKAFIEELEEIQESHILDFDEVHQLAKAYQESYPNKQGLYEQLLNSCDLYVVH